MDQARIKKRYQKDRQKYQAGADKRIDKNIKQVQIKHLNKKH